MEQPEYALTNPNFWADAARVSSMLYPDEDIVLFDHFKEPYPYGTFPRLLAIGHTAEHRLRLNEVEKVQDLTLDDSKWWIGYISYDAKDAFYPSGESKPRFDTGLAVHFISPRLLVVEDDKEHLKIWGGEEALKLVRAVSEAEISVRKASIGKGNEVINYADYERLFNQVQHHLTEGNIYELNLCRPVQHKGKVGKLELVRLYESLVKASPKPFMYYASLDGQTILGTSPERFLKRVGGKLVSQPIKGTLPRLDNPQLDKQQKYRMLCDEKIRAENMMITDLVRNDLMRCCEPGSVEVEELFAAYAFEQVWQLITTITGRQKKDDSLGKILEATFPMGSMTGAPKKRAIEIIEQLEPIHRGLFSGAIGYQAPGGNFDFAVIIRSLFYNHQNEMLWYQSGGAIVADSQVKEEWEELVLKAKALHQVLRQPRL